MLLERRGLLGRRREKPRFGPECAGITCISLPYGEKGQGQKHGYNEGCMGLHSFVKVLPRKSAPRTLYCRYKHRHSFQRSSAFSSDISQITPKFGEIIPPSHRHGNCNPCAAIRWHDFGNRPALGRPFGHFSPHPTASAPTGAASFTPASARPSIPAAAKAPQPSRPSKPPSTPTAVPTQGCSTLST